jgi:hypothetical protein
MTSSQQTAFVASIKHQTVNEIACDASPDIILREGNKGKRHGMMHTHLHCKQQEMKVVDDEVSMRDLRTKITGQNHGGYPRCSASLRSQCICTGIGQRENKKQNACRRRGWYLREEC